MAASIYKELHAKYTKHPNLSWYDNFHYSLGKTFTCAYGRHIHKNLRVLKNIHLGESAIVFGAGPSLLDYKELDDDTFIRVGCNRQFLREEILPFHLYILVDGGTLGKHSYIDEMGNLYDNYQPLWGKFYSIQPQHLYENFIKAKAIPFMKRTTGFEPVYYRDDYGNERKVNIEKLNQTSDIVFTKDISKDYLQLNSNVAFPIMQLLLYMGFAKIYLVGFDASGGGRWNYSDAYKSVDYAQNIAQWPKRWYFFRKWQKKEYPDVKVINVNPVALKGMMDDDIYT
tara:strand:- start:258 stop:1109 length:852 start_codon:yes stop_codon:yes gene_type:complete